MGLYLATCSEIIKTNIGVISQSLQSGVEKNYEKLVSCFYNCLKNEFEKRASILYSRYPPDSIAFLSDAAFTDAVLLLTARAKNGELYDGHASVKTVLSNFFMMKLREHLQRENRVTQKIEKYAAAFHSESPVTSTFNHFSSEEQFDAVQAALAKMEPDDQQIIKWRHLEEKSCDEIAQLLGINKASATNRIYRCMQRLRNLTENTFE